MAICGCTGQGAITCDGIAACLVQYLGPGLEWDNITRKFRVNLSGDAGQCLTFGSDNGIYYNCGGPPAPGGEGVTLASLPATGIVGAWRMGPSLGPENTLLAGSITHNAGADILHFDIRAGAETTGGLYLMRDTTFARTTTDTSTGYQDTPTQSPYAHSALHQWSLYVNSDDNAWFGNNLDTGTGTFEDPSSWIVQRIPLVTDVLAKFGKRVVLMPHIRRTAAVGTQTGIADMLLPYLSRYALQASTVVIADDLADLTSVTAANIAAGIHLADAAAATANPPATVVAAGVTWVLADRTLPDATITSYVTAGLNVLISRGNRHVHATRASTLATRGVLSADPIYTGKRFRSFVNVTQTTTGSIHLVKAVIPHGFLGDRSDVNDFSATTGRGYPTGTTTPGYWQTNTNIGAVDGMQYAVLMGAYYDETANFDPSSWRHQDVIRLDSTPDTFGFGMGLFFGMLTDDRIYVDGTMQTNINGYRVHWIPDGNWTMHVINSGVMTQIGTGTWRTGNMAIGTGYTMWVGVTATQILLYTGASPTSVGTVTNSVHRGRYIYRYLSNAVRHYTSSTSPRPIQSPWTP